MNQTYFLFTLIPIFRSPFNITSYEGNNCLFSTFSTHHVILEPYFHFPLGFLTWTKHLRPHALKKQLALHVPSTDKRTTRTPRTAAVRPQSLSLRFTSVWMESAVQQKPDPPAEIICNMTSSGSSLPLPASERGSISETSPGERSSPLSLCPLSRSL